MTVPEIAEFAETVEDAEFFARRARTVQFSLRDLGFLREL